MGIKESVRAWFKRPYLRRAQRMTHSEVFLDSVIENIPNMIFVKDAQDLRFVRFNKAGEDLIGYPQAAMIGKNDYDFFPKEQADAFTEKDRMVLKEGRVVDIPEEPINTSRGIRYLHTKKIPLYDKSGKPLYLLGISEDITDKKEAEQQRLRLLAEQMGRAEAEKTAERLSFLSEASASLNRSLDYKETVEAFAASVVQFMADWCVIEIINEAGEDNDQTIVHRDPEMAKWVYEFYKKYPRDPNASYGASQVMRTGVAELHTSTPTDRLKMRMGGQIDEELIDKLGFKSVMVVPLRTYDKVFGAIIFASATAEKVYDQLDLSLAQELASRASFAIENARLYKKTQEANRAKNAFLANMSHEVRTPLAAVLGFAQIIGEDETISGENKERIELVIGNGKQLLQILDEVLDISKIESDRMDIEFIQFNVLDLAKGILDLFENQAAEKNIELKLVHDSRIPIQVRSDPTRLRQILINIIGNAVKFTEKGVVTLEIREITASEVSGNGRLEFSVSDTGIGIPRGQEEHLFKPFSQGDSSMTRKFGGTGLGLFLSRKLARMLGGDLILKKSIEGKGSTFVCTVEISAVSYSNVTKIVPKAPVFEFDKNRHYKKGRVLAVDDSEDNRLLLKWFLNKIGFEVDVAANGREGIEKALSGDYSLVLLDIQMPDLDGFEVLKKLRQNNYQGPLVALTAHAMKGDRERCLAEGFTDYLSKPFDQEVLKAMAFKHATTEIAL